MQSTVRFMAQVATGNDVANGLAELQELRLQMELYVALAEGDQQPGKDSELPRLAHTGMRTCRGFKSSHPQRNNPTVVLLCVCVVCCPRLHIVPSKYAATRARTRGATATGRLRCMAAPGHS